METHVAPGRTGTGSWFSYEKLYPIAIAYCAVMIAIWIPIEISNTLTIYSRGRMFCLTILYNCEYKLLVF